MAELTQNFAKKIWKHGVGTYPLQTVYIRIPVLVPYGPLALRAHHHAITLVHLEAITAQLAHECVSCLCTLLIQIGYLH